MPTLVDGEVEQHGELKLTSPAFENGEKMPDWTGYANANENPLLEITDVPEDTKSLVLIMDDPDAEPVVGHVLDHWLVWGIDPTIGEIPRSWQPRSHEATVGYNDYGEADWGGPAPPEGSHTYHFKLFALADELELPPQARKAVVGHTIAFETDILASTQLCGSYRADQGTIF